MDDAELERRRSLFDRWYARPLYLLELAPSGDGGMIALGISLMLFDWYATAKSKKLKLNKQQIGAVLAPEFGLEQKVAVNFWDVFRNGILHGGVPRSLTESADGNQVRQPTQFYRLSHAYTTPIAVNNTGDIPYFEVQPWLLRDHVLRLWQDNPDRSYAVGRLFD